jgi:tetratricopeptide (TPR) repeat protein
MDRFAMHYVRRAQEAGKNCRRDDVRELARSHAGIAHYASGRLDAAERDLIQAVGILDKVNDLTGMFCHHFLRHVYSIRGDISKELAEAEAEIAIAAGRGDDDSLAMGHYGKADALARAGRIDEALQFATLAVERLRARAGLTVAIAHGVEGFARLQSSDYARARAALESSRRTINRTFFLIECVGPTYPLLVESLLGPRWADAESLGGPSRAVARKAWRESHFARFIGWRFPNYGPHALRVSGRASFALGKAKKAVRFFERAIVAAEKLGARYDLARAYLDASRVVREKADEYRRLGQELLDELGAVVPEAERKAVDQAHMRMSS